MGSLEILDMRDIKVGVAICACVLLCAGLSSCAADTAKNGVYAESMPASEQTETEPVRSQIVMDDTAQHISDNDDTDITSADTSLSDTSYEAVSSDTDTQEETVTTAPTAEQTEAVSSDTTVISSESSQTVQDITVSSAQTSASSAVTSSHPVIETTVYTGGYAENGYDKDFFSRDLFIGDSISTGYSLYGYLDPANVYAKVGLNPSTVLTKNVNTVYGDIGISEMISYSRPKRAYIMLGSNGIQFLSVKNMVDSTDTLVSRINAISPDTEIVIVSVPPVTTGYDSTVEDVNVMQKIDEYNNSLEGYCSANSIIFCDISDELKDDTGYFDAGYAEKDGMHFKPAAYKVVLGKIQTEVESNTIEKAETAPVTDIDTSLTDISDTDITEETDVSDMTDIPDELTETEPSQTEITYITYETDITVLPETTVPEVTEAVPETSAETAVTKTVKKTAEAETSVSEKKSSQSKTSVKSSEKKTAEKKTAEKNTAEKKTAEKKTAEKKTSVKKSTDSAKKDADKNTTGKKTSVKKTSSKTSSDKKTDAKKTSAKKSDKKTTSGKTTKSSKTSSETTVKKDEK